MIYTDNIVSKSLLAGIAISISGTIFLSCSSTIIGAVLFSVGLLSCVAFNFNLYTGKSGFLSDSRDARRLILVLLLNIFAVFLCGIIFRTLDSSIISHADTIVSSRLHTDLTAFTVRSLITGFLMTLAIESERSRGNHIVLILSVTAFILSGCFHCIADAFYYSASSVAYNNVGPTLIRLLLTIVFNFIGCVMYNLFVDKSIILQNYDTK